MTREERAATRRQEVLAALRSNGPGGAYAADLVHYSVPPGERKLAKLHRLHMATLRADLYVLESQGKAERIPEQESDRGAVRWRAIELAEVPR